MSDLAGSRKPTCSPPRVARRTRHIRTGRGRATGMDSEVRWFRASEKRDLAGTCPR
jgi:hypothetical protein